MTENQLFDLKELYLTAAGDKLFTADMIRLFISQNEISILDIRELLTKREYRQIRTILHRMKSSVMVMGVKSVKELIDQYERLDFDAPDEQRIETICLEIVQLLDQVNKQLGMI